MLTCNVRREKWIESNYYDNFIHSNVNQGKEFAVQKFAIISKISAKFFGFKLTMWATKHKANVVFADE